MRTIVCLLLALAFRASGDPYDGKAAQIPVFAAKDVVKSYGINEVAADQALRNRTVYLTGTIRDFATATNGKPMILLNERVTCLFEKESIPVIARLHKDDSICVFGIIGGRWISNIVLKECEVRPVPTTQ